MYNILTDSATRIFSFGNVYNTELNNWLSEYFTAQCAIDLRVELIFPFLPINTAFLRNVSLQRQVLHTEERSHVIRTNRDWINEYLLIAIQFARRLRFAR